MQGISLPFIHFLFSSIVTFLSIKITIPIFKKFFPANPTERGMHNKVKPTSGGILFIISYSLLALYQEYYLALLSLPLAIIGLIDDKLNLSKLVRYLAQVITLIIILLFLQSQNIGFLNSNHNLLLYSLMIFLGSAIINFINFMDGIDGLICGSMIIILATLNTQFHYLSPLIGALTAFLYYNWNPSKIFMGDAGSLFLGSFLVSLLYSSESYFSFTKNLLLCSPLLLDSLVCIIKRLIKKQNIFKSHKLHLYQRLVSNGMSHSKVSILYMLSILFLSLVYNFMSTKFLIIAVILICIMAIFLDKKYAVNFHH